MPRKAPGAHERSLGAELRTIREAIKPKLTVTKAAEQLGWSKSMLSNLENGKRKISSEEVAALLAVYRITDERRDTLIERAKGGHGPGLWERNLPGLPQESNTLAGYEAEANKITNWQPLLIPGLLQTMYYTKAFMLADGIDPQHIELRLMARLRRQQALRGDVSYLALIGEAALHTRVGGPKVMADQLRAVRKAAAASNVRVRVVPTEAVHPAMWGSFDLVEFETASPIVHIEMLRSGIFLERQDSTPYLDAVAHIESVALTATESLRLVSARAEELEGKT